MRRKIIVLLSGFVLSGCHVIVDSFEDTETKEAQKLYVISDLRFKTFIYNNGSDSVFIKTPFEKGFKKMEVDAINEKNEYNMRISDLKYYRKIKKDTIIIKVGNKIEKYVMISNKK